MPYWYWSSTVVTEDIDSAWCVSLYDGGVNYYKKSGFYYVQAVRNRTNTVVV